jgi:hypothetical protein
MENRTRSSTLNDDMSRRSPAMAFRAADGRASQSRKAARQKAALDLERPNGCSDAGSRSLRGILADGIPRPRKNDRLAVTCPLGITSQHWRWPEGSQRRCGKAVAFA